MAFKYRGGKRKVEEVVKRSKQSGGGYDQYINPDFQKFKAKEGENIVRILPPTWPESEMDKWGDGWEVPIQIHYSVGPDNAAYLCRNKMLGETCPVCEARREAADQEEADQLRPNWRALVWVIDRNNEKAGPQWWDMPIGVFREVNSRSVDKKSNGLILIDDPEEGYDIFFNREGNDQRTKYTSIEIDRDPTPLAASAKQQDAWLTYIEEHPLPELLNFYDADYVEKVLFGKSERRGKAEPEEEEETPRARRRRPEPEAEEEEVTDRRTRRQRESEAEDEEVKPRSRRSRAEPEEEEEKPRTRRGRTAEPEEEEEEKPRGRKAKQDDLPFDEDPEPEPAPRRRRVAEPEEEEEEEGETPSAQGRKALGRLRNRR